MLLLFSFIIYLYFLIPAVIAQTFIYTAELVMSARTATNKGNTETKTQPVTDETKISKSSIFKYLQVFLYFHSLSHYILFQLKDNFLFHQFFVV